MTEMTEIPHRRVLMVEFVNADQFPGRINFQFPFVRGFLEEQGASVRWIRYGLDTTNLLRHQRDEVTLSDGELERLVALTREHRPELILIDDPIYPPQADALCEASPGVLIRDLRRRNSQPLPEYPLFEGGRELRRPEFRPIYDWIPGNDAARNREMDNVYLASAGRCGHPRNLISNPLYEKISDERVVGHRGCAFCYGMVAREGAADVGRTPLDWFERQIAGIAASRETPERYPNALLLEMVERPEVIQHCIDGLMAHGLAEHVQVLFAARTDQMPRIEGIVREHFRRYPEAGVRLGVYASGIESFFDRDLQLFNKGTTALDGLRAVNILRELAYELPERFWYTGLSFILHTPWTTPEGLHLNLGLLRLIGLTRDEAGNLFQARLRLHPRLPITCLAEEHGLVLDEEADPTLRMNRRKLFEDEKPWRYEDERLRPLMRVFSRFELLGTDLADAFTREVEARVRRIGSNQGGFHDRDLIDLLMAMAEVVRATPEPLEELDLADRAAELVAGRRAAAKAAPGPERWRIGEERVDLAGLLERLAGVLESGLKRVVTVRDVLEADLDGGVSSALAERDLAHALVGGSPGTLVVALTREDLERWQAASEAGDLRALGALHGYPACCVEAFAEGAFADVELGLWPAFAKRLETDGPVPAGIDPVRVPSLAFVPCRPDCEQAEAHYAAAFGAIGCRDPFAGPRDAAYLFSLGGRGDGELVILDVESADEDGLRCAGAGLGCGDRLRFVPGQIQVLAGDAPEAIFTVTHGVWYPPRAWHGEHWREMARGAAWVARTGRGYEDVPATNAHGAGEDQGGGTEGAAAEREQSPFVRWLMAHGARIGEVVTQRSGFEVVGLTPAAEDVRFSLRQGEAELELFVEEARKVERAFRKGRLFAISYGHGTSPDSEEKQAAIDTLLKVLERAAAGPAKRKGA